MHRRGVKNQKNHFPNLDSKITPKVSNKSSKLPPKSIQNVPKMLLEFNLKIWWKTEPGNLEFGVQHGWGFWRFWLLKIDLQRHLEPSWAPKLTVNDKRHQKVQKITTCCTEIVFQIGKKPSTKKQYQILSDFVWIKLPSPLNGLAVCAERLNNKLSRKNFR